MNQATNYDPGQYENRRGGPRQLTVHLFEGDGCGGAEQHLGSITFPYWMEFGGTLEDQPGPFEMAARVWNQVVAQQDRVYLGFGITVVGRDDPVPVAGTWLGDCDNPLCDQCLGKARHPEFWAAFAKVVQSGFVDGQLNSLDVDSWTANDTDEGRRSMWGPT